MVLHGPVWASFRHYALYAHDRHNNTLTPIPRPSDPPKSGSPSTVVVARLGNLVLATESAARTGVTLPERGTAMSGVRLPSWRSPCYTHLRLHPHQARTSCWPSWSTYIHEAPPNPHDFMRYPQARDNQRVERGDQATTTGLLLAAPRWLSCTYKTPGCRRGLTIHASAMDWN